MSGRLRIFLYIIILIIGGVSNHFVFAASQVNQSTPNDSVRTRYSVRKTVVEDETDIDKNYPVDLKTPSNIKGDVEYDYLTNSYVYKTKVGDQVISIPISMTKEEYLDYTERNLIKSYYRSKNSELFEKGTDSEFNFLDMQFVVGPA